MVAKNPIPSAAENAGVFRRARMQVRPERVENIRGILKNIESHPSPIRAVGADYSQTRCVGGGGGTTLDTSHLNKIIAIEDDLVRVQAGVRVGDLVRTLAARGLELLLTPEIGNISAGTLATAVLPQPSPEDGMANMSSCVTAMKLITPQGKPMTVSEAQPAVMRVLRSSFGLLGVVHEVELKIREMIPVKIDYRSFSLQEFASRYTEIIDAPAALRLHLFPFSDRITVERRTLDLEAAIGRSGIWQIRNSVMRNVLPAFGASVGGVLSAPGLRYCLLSGVERAAHAALDRAATGVVMYAHEWLRELPREAWKARFTYSLWGFSQAYFPQLLKQYFEFCHAYYQQHRYRCNVVHTSTRLHRDRHSLFSLSYDGPAFTIEPASTQDAGWDDFLIDFNEFAYRNGGKPTFNQTRALQPEHVLRAFGERLTLFRALQKKADPGRRVQNTYFEHLLG